MKSGSQDYWERTHTPSWQLVLTLPGSLLLLTAAGLLAAHVPLHFPHWLLCCLYFKRKHFKFWLVITRPKTWNAEIHFKAYAIAVPQLLVSSSIPKVLYRTLWKFDLPYLYSWVHFWTTQAEFMSVTAPLL